jgi:hypothetical protein
MRRNDVTKDAAILHLSTNCGLSVREIAFELDLRRSYVHRFLQRIAHNKAVEEKAVSFFQKKSADANVDVVAGGGEFPREMLVSDFKCVWLKALVIAKTDRQCVVAEANGVFSLWNHCKEVEPELKYMELTIDEIASRFGVSSDQIKIVK